MAQDDFLRAECEMARSNGEKSMMVNVSELKSILHRLGRFEAEEAMPVKPFGYAISREMRGICSGKSMFVKVKRSRTGRHDCQVFFREIPTEDGVDILAKVEICKGQAIAKTE